MGLEEEIKAQKELIVTLTYLADVRETEYNSAKDDFERATYVLAQARQNLTKLYYQRHKEQNDLQQANQNG